MKAKISYRPSLFDDEETTITVYGKDRKSLISLAFAIEKADGFVVTNLFITDDQVQEKVDS